jgi:hypothetical protein
MGNKSWMRPTTHLVFRCCRQRASGTIESHKTYFLIKKLICESCIGRCSVFHMETLIFVLSEGMEEIISQFYVIVKWNHNGYRLRKRHRICCGVFQIVLQHGGKICWKWLWGIAFNLGQITDIFFKDGAIVIITAQLMGISRIPIKTREWWLFGAYF